MGEFKGFMKYNKQSLSELSLVDRLSGHDAFQQRFTKEDASVQGARCMDCGTPFCQTGQLYGRNYRLSYWKLYTRVERFSISSRL